MPFVCIRNSYTIYESKYAFFFWLMVKIHTIKKIGLLGGPICLVFVKSNSMKIYGWSNI